MDSHNMHQVTKNAVDSIKYPPYDVKRSPIAHLGFIIPICL